MCLIKEVYTISLLSVLCPNFYVKCCHNLFDVVFATEMKDNVENNMVLFYSAAFKSYDMFL